MQQIIKKFQPFIWGLAIVFATIFVAGCNSETEKSEAPASVEQKADAPDSTAQTKTDSLPPIDKSASSRPEGVKTVPEQR